MLGVEFYDFNLCKEDYFLCSDKQIFKDELNREMKIKQLIIQIYLMIMLGFFPLYYQNRYYNMGDAKYQFFKYTTMGAAIFLLGVWIFEITRNHFYGIREGKIIKRKSNSTLDISVMAYIVAVGVSWLLSDYRTETWIGSIEWYMGFFSQILFVGIYFMISRNMKKSKWPLWTMIAGGIIAFFIAYLHRFRVDPLGMYEGVSERYWHGFLGTIGNATWYSSYVCVVLPVVMGRYVVREESYIGKCEYIAESAFIIMGFATLCTQNSDSAYVGIGLCIIFLLWFSLENIWMWKHFLELLLLGLTAIKTTGILQSIFSEKAMILSPISMELTKGCITWIALGVVIIFYWQICKKIKDVPETKDCLQQSLYKLRKYLYAGLIIGVLALVILIWLATKNVIKLESGILAQSGYLVFNEKWGSERGEIWMYAVRIFEEYSPIRKLFGIGPDALAFYSETFHQEEVRALWGNAIATNVHNEWLNSIINYGVVGGVAYISVFIITIVNVIKYWKNNSTLLALGAAIVSYMGHNLFCYQQAVCTPLIFIMIGASEYIRKNLNGTS